MKPNDIKIGNILHHDEKLCLVQKREHVRTGKGGAYISVVMKDIKTGNKVDYRFNCNGENVHRAILDESCCEFSYFSDDNAVLMDENYETIEVPKELFDGKSIYLEAGMEVKLRSFEDVHIFAEVPSKVELEIVDTQASIKGQTVTSSYKPAEMSNGITVNVPTFLGPGDRIIVSTEDEKYVGRSKKE